MKNIKEEILSNKMTKEELIVKKLLSERKRLLKEGYDPVLVENAFWDWFKGSKNSAGDAVVQVIKKQIFMAVIKYFGFSETSFFAQAIANAFANVPITRLYEFFTNCNYFVSETTKAILETFVDKWRISVNQGSMDSLLGQALKEVIVEGATNTAAYKSLESKLLKFVCPMLKEVSSKIDLGPFKSVASFGGSSLGKATNKVSSSAKSGLEKAADSLGSMAKSALNLGK